MKHTPYRVTGSGTGPYDIIQGSRSCGILRNTTLQFALRTGQCLTVCAGMEDPAAEIAALRESNKALVRTLKTLQAGIYGQANMQPVMDVISDALAKAPK